MEDVTLSHAKEHLEEVIVVPPTVEPLALHTDHDALFRFEQVECDVAQDSEVMG